MINVVSTLLFIAYPLSIHLSILTGFSELLAWIVLIVASAHALLAYQDHIKLLIYTSIAVLALFNVVAEYSFVIYLPPIIIPVFMLTLFAGSLKKGREAFITQIARRISDNGISEKEVRYTRQVTWVWSIFFVAMIIETVLLTIYVDRETWSVFTNIYNYLFIAALFIIEYAFRMFYFKRLPSVMKLKNLFNNSH